MEDQDKAKTKPTGTGTLLRKASQLMAKAEQVSRTEIANARKTNDTIRSILFGHVPGLRQMIDKLVIDEDARAKLRSYDWL